jgi:hypothetical protein
MCLVREVGTDDWAILREIRLAALREAPQAFGSTYQREARFTEAQWRERIKSRSVTFFAHLDEDAVPAGIAAAGWARARDHDTLFLWVTELNAPARRLYERCGFTPSGERQPLPSDPTLAEIRMRRPL